MIKISKIALVALLIGGLGATVASADAAKGQKLYSKKLKKECAASGVANGAKMAAKHTQGEWEEIGVKGVKAEIEKICPKVKEKSLKSKYLKDYYDFFYNFASDSGNVPSC